MAERNGRTELGSERVLLPGLIVYALSFALVGIYWNNHHHLLRARNESVAP